MFRFDFISEVFEIKVINIRKKTKLTLRDYNAKSINISICSKTIKISTIIISRP
jgi:hypothetical protein